MTMIAACAGLGAAKSAMAPSASAEAPSRSAFRAADFLAISGIKQSPASRYEGAHAGARDPATQLLNSTSEQAMVILATRRLQPKPSRFPMDGLR